MDSESAADVGQRTFPVGVDTLAGTRGGDLEVAPGSLVCRLGRSWGAAGDRGPDTVTHIGRAVEMYHARAPFLSNVGLLVSDGHWAMTAHVGMFRRRALVAALESAGFAVNQHRTWFDKGKGGLRRP